MLSVKPAVGALDHIITCNPGASYQAAEIPIVAVVGPEFVTGSTRMKAGTAQKLILNMISASVMIRMGHVKVIRWSICSFQMLNSWIEVPE